MAAIKVGYSYDNPRTAGGYWNDIPLLTRGSSGSDTVRIDVPFSAISSSTGAFAPTAKMAAFKNSGLKVLPVFRVTGDAWPAWTGGSAATGPSGANLFWVGWAAYKILEYFGAVADAIEVENETNVTFGTRASVDVSWPGYWCAWVQLYNQRYLAGTKQVISPGVLCVGTQSTWQTYLTNLKAWYEYAYKVINQNSNIWVPPLHQAIHPYPASVGERASAGAAQTAILSKVIAAKNATPAPLWVTETGIGAVGAITEAAKATALRSVYNSLATDYQMRAFLLFTLWQPDTAYAGSIYEKMRTIDTDGTKRATYTTLRDTWVPPSTSPTPGPGTASPTPTTSPTPYLPGFTFGFGF